MPVDIGTLTGTIAVSYEGKPAFAALDTDLSSAGTKLNTLTAKSDDVKTAFGALSTSATATASSLATVSAPAATLNDRFASVQASGDRVRAMLAGLGPSAASATTPVTAVGTATQTLTQRFDAIQSSGDRVRAVLAGLGPASASSIPPITSIGTAAATTGSQINTLGARFGSLGSLLLGGGVLTAVAAVATTFVSLGKAAFDNADSLVKMSDKTGIGVEALQRLQAVGDASGNSIEQISSGVNRLQKALEEGSKQTRSAVDGLGLSLSDLKTLKPEDQFAAVAGAIQSIHDPAKQAQLAMELFGRSGAELLPTLKANIQGIGDATKVMSDETVRNLDDAGDAWKAFYRNLTVITGTFIAGFIQQNKDLQREAKNTIDRMKDIDTKFLERQPIAPAVMMPWGENAKTPGLPSPEMMDLLDSQFKALQKSSAEAMKPINAFNAALKAVQGQLSGSDLLQKAREYEIVLGKIGGASSLTSKETETVAAAYNAVIEKYSLLGPAGEATVTKFQALLAPLTGHVVDLSASLAKARGELAGMSEAKLDELTNALQSGAFTMKEMTTATGLSETAIKLFKQQIDDAGKGTKDATSIFDDYNKKVGQLGIALTEALKFDAPIEFVKTQFGGMIKSVVQDAAILGKTVPPLIADAFLAITIKDGADHLLKEFAKFGDDMNKQVKADLDRVNKEFTKTLSVIIAADNQTADSTAKFLDQGLQNQIKNLEAITGVTKRSLDLRRQLYLNEYQEELALLQRKADADKRALDSTGALYSQALTAIDNETNVKMELAAQTFNQKIKEMKTSTALWAETLGILSKAFADLAAISGSSFGGIAKDIGTVIGAMDLANKGTKTFLDGISNLGSINGWAKAIAGIATAFAALQQATSSASTGANIAGGAATGAEIGASVGSYVAKFAAAGSVVPIYGTIIGAVAGAVYGWLKSKANSDFMTDVGREWGTTISTAMAAQIKKDTKDIFHGERLPAEIFDMSGIIKGAGGLNPENLDGFTKKLRDVFSMLQTGAFTSAQAVHVLDENWKAFVEAGTDEHGRLSAGLKEIIQLTVEGGLKTKEIAEYMKNQASTAMTGFAAVMKVAALSTKQELNDMGLVALASINAAIKAGMSMPEALRAAGPALAQLSAGYKTLGVDVDNVALKTMLFQSDLLTKNPDLLAAVDGLSASMIALDNIGGLNVETFDAMERTGSLMYLRLQAAAAAAGGTTKDALMPMQEWLHNADEQAKLLNIPLDANTQQMIAQSKELGIWKERGMTPTEKLTEGMQGVVTSLDKMIERMDAIIGKNFPDKHFTVTAFEQVVHHDDGPKSDAPVDPNPGFAGGTGGQLVDFGPRGTLVTLHNKEGVFTEAESKAGRGSNVVDIAPLLEEQRRTRASVDRLTDFFDNRFDKKLARSVRDERQKATRR